MTRRTGLLYWLLVVLLVGFGVLALLSIGFPFVVTGLALAVLAPFRGNPRTFWPALAGVLAFLAGATLVVPLTCTASEVAVALSEAPSPGHTVCTSALGFDYSGTTPYEPSYLPALAVGLTCGLLVGAGARFAIVRSR